MTQQQFHETVALEYEFMDSWTKEFLKEHAEDFFCWNCLEPKQQDDCCTAKHFIRLKDMPELVQRNIVNNEYDKAYGK